MKLFLTTIIFFGLSFIAKTQEIEQKINFFERSEAKDIVATADGGFLIVGRDFDPIQEKDGALIFKLGASGNVLWKSLYHQEDGTTTKFLKVIETTHGEIIALGSSIKYNTPDPGNVTSAVVMKLDEDGTEIWTKSFANPGEMLWNTVLASHMHEYTDGGVIITMNISSGYCGGAAVMRLSADGTLIWSKNYHSVGDARDILVKPTGEIYFTGSINDAGIFKAHLTKVNPIDGTQIISRMYSFSEAHTYGRELIFDGASLYLAGNHEGSLYVVKLLNDGTYESEWSIFVGESMDIPLDAEIINDQIVLAGVRFGGGQISVIAQIDFDGNLIDDYVFSNSWGALNIYAIYPYGSDQVTVAGTFDEGVGPNSSIYFGKSSFPLPLFCSFKLLELSVETAPVTISTPIFAESDSPVERPITVEKVQLSILEIDAYCSLTEIIESSENITELKMYPNPANDMLQIESSVVMTALEIYDAAGKLVLQENIKDIAFQKAVDISVFKSGIYLIEVTTENGVVHERFVKR
jgi:hypothetical protein